MSAHTKQLQPGSPEAIERARWVLESTGNLELWAALFFPRRMQQSAADKLKAEIDKLRRELKNGGGEPRLLRLKAAANYLSVSPACLRKLTVDGEIAVTRANQNPGTTSPWLFDVRDLDAWAESRKERF